MSVEKNIQLGLCCLNTILRGQNPPVFCSRSIILKTFEDKGLGYLQDKIIENLKDLIRMIEWNEKHGIRVMRISSELFPHKSNLKAPDYEFDFALDLLKDVGTIARKYGHRLTFHPGQYNVIGTPNPDVFEKTILDLDYQATVLDLMGLDNNSVMVIHGGGVYGNKKETIERWKKQYGLLPEHIKRRLVLENCERCFSIKDCIEISKDINIPVVLDTHHFECYKLLHPEEEFDLPENYISDILESWKRKSIKPKFHVSEQGSGRIGHHSDYIKNIPMYLLEIPVKYNTKIDIMIEAKMKEQAIFKLYQKYPFLSCLDYNEVILCQECRDTRTNFIIIDDCC